MTSEVKAIETSHYVFAVASPSAASIEPGEKFQSYNGMYEGHRVRVDPPVRISPYSWRPLPQIHEYNIHKIIPGSRWPGLTPTGILISPEENGVKLEVSHGFDIPESNDHPDIFLVAVLDQPDPVIAEKTVSDFSHHFFK